MNWKALAFPLKSFRRPSRQPQSNHFHPRLEVLEDRVTPTGSITGSVFIDATGNGSAPANAPQSGVNVRVVYDTNHNGVLDGRDKVAAEQRTAANGSYLFTKLAAGTYFVEETVPRNFVRTVPSPQNYYKVTVSDGQTTTVKEFDNFHELKDVVRKVSFTIQRGTKTFTVVDLHGKTRQGDIVTANFTVPAGATTTLSLVSYTTPSAHHQAATASQDVVADAATGTFGPGAHSLTVHIPDNFYQIDFVVGAVIQKFGDKGSHINYRPQHRLLSADHGGTTAPVVLSSLSGQVTANGVGLTALVILEGTNDLGQPVSLSVWTDPSGNYSFSNLRPGTYSLTEMPASSLYTLGMSSVSAGSSGTAGVGTITDIHVTSGVTGVGYNFTQLFIGGGSVLVGE